MKKLVLLALAMFSFNVLAAPVNINTADAKTISDALSGIGIQKAEAIVKYRTENGPFKAVEDLTNVKGIGEKTIAKNKTDILLEDASAAAPTAVPAVTAEEPKKYKKIK